MIRIDEPYLLRQALGDGLAVFLRGAEDEDAVIVEDGLEDERKDVVFV